jgi:hypothetical protein
MLSPRKLPVKGTAYGRVPPLCSGQTPDSDLPRQDPAPVGEDGGEILVSARLTGRRCHMPDDRGNLGEKPVNGVDPWLLPGPRW